MGLAGALAWQIATGTAYDAHPDENLHVEAFCYYQLRRWTPPINTDELDYGQYGLSRVYSGQVVYWIYGRAAALLSSAHLPPAAVTTPETDLGAQLALCKPGYTTYRLFNVALLVGTLGVLFAGGPAALALLTFALVAELPLSSLGKALLLGLLVALVYLAKPTMWIAIPFALTVIGNRLWRSWRAGALTGRPEVLRVVRNTTAATAVFILAIAPTTIIYPWSQDGHLRELLRQAQEQRAWPGFKPSNPSWPRYRLRAKGAGFDQIVLNPHWIADSARSFYGLFGYMTIRSPAWAYLVALTLGAANALLSVRTAWRNWKQLPDSLRLTFSLAPAVIGAVVGASMHNSWTGDYQP